MGFERLNRQTDFSKKKGTERNLRQTPVSSLENGGQKQLKALETSPVLIKHNSRCTQLKPCLEISENKLSQVTMKAYGNQNDKCVDLKQTFH